MGTEAGASGDLPVNASIFLHRQLEPFSRFSRFLMIVCLLPGAVGGFPVFFPATMRRGGMPSLHSWAGTFSRDEPSVGSARHDSVPTASRPPSVRTGPA